MEYFAPRRHLAAYPTARLERKDCDCDQRSITLEVPGRTYFLATTPINADIPLWPVPSWISAS